MRTVRELIRVLERACSNAPRGDLTEVRVEGEDGPLEIPGEVPGEGETALGAHFDPQAHVVVIETAE